MRLECQCPENPKQEQQLIGVPKGMWSRVLRALLACSRLDSEYDTVESIERARVIPEACRDLLAEARTIGSDPVSVAPLAGEDLDTISLVLFTEAARRRCDGQFTQGARFDALARRLWTMGGAA